MRMPALLLLLLLPADGSVAADAMDCVPARPLLLNVRIGDATPAQQVLLVGSMAPALRVVDVRTGTTLWSAGSAAPAMQHFAAMTAAFAGSLAALDTDNDGLHDRLYAGDLAGRLWRFDLHNGAPAATWASGGVFADFSNDAGRGFLAPPDVSLAAAPRAAPWLNIALGTAAPGHVAAGNRFYVLRDYTPFAAWTEAQYRDWPPLREADLLRVTTAGQPPDGDVVAGWFIELDHGEVITAAVTVANRTTVAIAESTTRTATGCRSAFSIATLQTASGHALVDALGNWRRLLPMPLASDATFTIAMDGGGADPARALCMLDDARIAGCDVDTRPRRTWWRRGNAE
jgi:hypothetical protein